jgi:hypothetical protein
VNAENVLHIVDEPTAVRFAEFADRVAARYGSVAQNPAAPAAPPPR